MPTCGIYMYRNKINGKVYIGQTVNVYLRRRQHENPTGQDRTHQFDSDFHRDLREYGIENFEFSLLEECLPQELNEREVYWINKYKSTEIGYNVKKGGSGGWVNGKPVLQIEIGSGIIVEEYQSIRSAARAVGCNAGDIKRVCIGQLQSASGYAWCLKDDYHKDKYIGMKQHPRRPFVKAKPVLQIDLQSGEVVNEYPSVHEAAKAMGVHRNNIYNVCQHKWKTSCGYRWEYKTTTASKAITIENGE